MSFNLCCANPKIKPYQIDHHPKPKDWQEDVLDAIQMLLWYIPNIDSVQSKTNKLIEDLTYDNLTFAYILKSLAMSQDDVLLLESGEIDEDVWEHYQQQICTQCQKVILVRRKNKTKTEDLLRCIRNAVAHGDFTVVDDMFIGFNKYRDQKKAIIKIKPKNLLSALETITSKKEYSKVKLLEFALTKKGFKTEREARFFTKNRMAIIDLLAEKDGIKYIFEFKSILKRGYLHPVHVEPLLKQLTAYRDMLKSNDTKLVLVIDEGRLTKASWELIHEMDNLVVLDINSIMNLPFDVSFIDR